MSDLELNAPDGNDDHPAVQAFLNRKEKPAMTIPEQAVEGTSEKIARLLAELKSERLLRDFEVRYAPGARRTLKPAAFELQDRIVELVSNSYKLDGSRQPLVGVEQALPPLRAREETARKTVWLVVRDGLYTEYRNAGSPNWVADPWRAAEYETFEAAEYARKQITFDEWRNRSKSIEHIFINRPKTIASDG